MTTLMPSPKLKKRVIDESKVAQALASGLPVNVARIYAARPSLDSVLPIEFLEPKLKMLTAPESLPDVDKAAQRIIQALINQEIIGIETDHDCDGQTSHAVLFTVLTQHFNHPVEKVRSYIGHRMQEGYGLSEPLMKRILADELRPSLIITADNGSSDEKQIAVLKAQGIDVIVTDHHEIPVDGIPQSAYAVVNPIREDGEYPDKYIAGCMVAWLLMAYTRAQLIQHHQRTIESMATCLDFVAVGTVADCVSMARSLNNRIVVSYGMKLIQQGLRPCWRTILPLCSTPMISEDLGFKIGPLLNSDGRLACAFGSVSFLLAESDDEAQEWVHHLQSQNTERKAIQEQITNQALKEALIQIQNNQKSLCIYLKDGHAGVHGICASRLKEWFGRPVFIFSPKLDSEELITGSGRSIDGFHLKKALESIAHDNPDLITRYGGHQGAAGLTLPKAHFERFQTCLEQYSQTVLNDEMVGPVIWIDDELDEQSFTLSNLDMLVDKLEPFGREFDPPVFEAQGTILAIETMGKTAKHARVMLQLPTRILALVWFNCVDEQGQLPIQIGNKARIALTPRLQTYRGERRLSCQLLGLEPLL